MDIQQLYLGCLAQASYLVFDEKTKVAAIIDPRRDVDIYLEEAQRRGAKIEHVLLTHFHADFVSGHIELVQKTGATIALGAAGQPEYEHRALRDGNTIEFGDVRLKILETPGHTPESICIVAYDLSKDPEHPHAVFTGDTLFVGDVGRPDLMASIGMTAEELAGMLYDSLHEKLMKLPDDTIVYPGHGAGSMCGKNLSTDTSTTIGAQKAVNYALSPMSKDEFIAQVTANQPQAPAYFGHDALLNRKKRATLEEKLSDSYHPLTRDEFLKQVESYAQVIDVRTADEFAKRHFRESINIGLDGKYATWAGTVLDNDRPIVVIAPPGREKEAIVRLGRIGYDHVVGYLEGGIESLEDDERIARLHRLDTQELDEIKQDVLLLDIRNPGEWQDGHIPGSLNIPLGQLQGRIDELTRRRPIVLICRSGYRSSIGVSILERAGFSQLHDLRGGMLDWQEDGLEVVQPVA